MKTYLDFEMVSLIQVISTAAGAAEMRQLGDVSSNFTNVTFFTKQWDNHYLLAKY